jgi:endogenous inhibitor of DNA gyrase (YacG/DUF329 family)
LIDLGRWLDEAHALPLPPAVDADEDAEALGGDSDLPQVAPDA